MFSKIKCLVKKKEDPKQFAKYWGKTMKIHFIYVHVHKCVYV